VAESQCKKGVAGTQCGGKEAVDNVSNIAKDMSLSVARRKGYPRGRGFCTKCEVGDMDFDVI
jgi:hypothetical protein